jgi:membrane-bound serine protease (ClpP class)
MLWVILFFAAGMVLIFSEFFLPGGILGIIGGLLILTSTALGYQAAPDYFLFILVGELLGAALCIGLGFWVLTQTKASSLLALDHTLTQESGYVSAESDLKLLGQEGVAMTALRPAGSARIGEERIDVVSDGTFLEEGTRIVVVEVKGSRVVVEAAPVSSTEQ